MSNQKKYAQLFLFGDEKMSILRIMSMTGILVFSLFLLSPNEVKAEPTHSYCKLPPDDPGGLPLLEECDPGGPETFDLTVVPNESCTEIGGLYYTDGEKNICVVKEIFGGESFVLNKAQCEGAGGFWINGDCMGVQVINILVGGREAERACNQSGGRVSIKGQQNIRGERRKQPSGSYGKYFTCIHDAKAVNEAVWTDWLNRDTPGGSGDFETVKDFLDAGQIPRSPVGIECQTTTGIDWDKSGRIYSCTIKTGGVCRNDQQANGQHCLDYQVRFLIPNGLPLQSGTECFDPNDPDCPGNQANKPKK